MRAKLALGLAAAVLGGCTSQRVTAVELVGSGANAAGTGGDASSAGATSAGDGSGGTPSSTCTDPAFVTSSPTGIWSDGGYFVFNNMWNTDAGPGPQTLYACSYHDWYVISEQTDDAGAVKTYPNVQQNFSDVPLSSFHGIASTFAEQSPRVGIYEAAFDIWLNGVAAAGSTQILIWVDNYNQVPIGSRVATTTLGGRTYDVWNNSDNSHITLVATETFTSGSLDLLEIFEWTTAQGWLPPGSTLGQIDFGVEIVSTAGANATFQFNAFAITTN